MADRARRNVHDRLRRRVAVLGAVWVAVTTAVLLVPGCYGDNCTGEAKFYGANPGEGRMLDENTWESNPIEGKWLDFPRQRLYSFDLHELGDRQPAIIIPYLSPASEPLKLGSNFTVGGGNLTEISGVSRNSVSVHNGTCSDYFLRLVVIAAPRAPVAEAGAPDASVDVTVNDASTDSSSDAEGGS